MQKPLPPPPSGWYGSEKFWNSRRTYIEGYAREVMKSPFHTDAWAERLQAAKDWEGMFRAKS